MRILPIGEPIALEFEVFAIEQRLEVGDLSIAQGQDVRFVDRAELDVPDAAGFENVDLLLRFGGDLVGESADGEHGAPMNKKDFSLRG